MKKFLSAPLATILLFLITIAIFSPSIRYGFVHIDDHAYVVDNPLVLSGLSVRNVRDAFFRAPTESGMYLPLLWISYMVDVTFFGASASNPLPFHAVNIILHATDAVLFFFLLLRLSRFACRRSSENSNPPSGTLFSFLLALLWAVHPLRVESVAWVAKRKDVLSLFFALLSILSYVYAFRPGKDSDPPSPSSCLPEAGSGNPKTVFLFASLSFLAFTAALLVKPTLIPLPLLLPAIDRLVLGRPLTCRHFLVRIPFFLLSGIAAITTLWGHRFSHPPIPLAVRIGHLPQTLVFYIRQTLFPHHLSVLVPDPAYALIPALMDALLLTALLFLAFCLRRRAPMATLGIVWFFLFLLPVSGLSAIPNMPIADRFSYIPALGISVALLPIFDTAVSPHIRRAGAILLSVVLLGFAVLSLRVLPHWRSGDALYDRARLFAPRHRILLSFDFGRAFAKGEFSVACGIAATAMSIHPDAPQFAVFYAMAIANTDGPEPAFGFLSARRPASGQYLGEWAWEMATLTLRLGRRADALAFADLSDSELPAASGLRDNIARLRAAAGTDDPAAALPHYMSQWRIYERADALEFFRRLVAAYPSRPDVLANVAWILSTADWSPAPPAEALDLARRALSLVPGNPPPELLDTLAAALANATDFPAAVAAQERAISLLPTDAPSRPAYLSRLALYRQSFPYRHDLANP